MNSCLPTKELALFPLYYTVSVLSFKQGMTTLQDAYMGNQETVSQERANL